MKRSATQFAPRAAAATKRAITLMMAGLSPIHPATTAVAEIPINIRIAQSGAVAGIRNTLHTVWLPAGQAFKNLSGHITLTGNHPGFSEALVMLGYAGQDQAECARSDGTIIPDMPTITRLWAGILKSNDTSPVSVPVSVHLDTPVPPARPDRGACLATLVSAGYPYLRRDVALYATTTVQLRVATAPSGGPVITFGMGGEFRLSGNTAAPQNVYVGIQAEHPLLVDSLAASVSAAPVANAPEHSVWSAGIQGRWDVSTSFVVIPAAACRSAHFTGYRAHTAFNVLRSATPSTTRPPPGSAPILDVALASRDLVAAQATRYQGFGTPARPLRLEVGDCLITFEQAKTTDGAGQIDVENQSTVYLREAR